MSGWKWEFRGGQGRWVLVDADDQQLEIAGPPCSDLSHFPAMALMAAAPDLLTACKAFANAMRCKDKPDLLLLIEALQLADAAIAKAEPAQ